METHLKESILNLITEAENARALALSEEKRDELGYPFVCGYATATLRNIRDLVERN